MKWSPTVQKTFRVATTEMQCYCNIKEEHICDKPQGSLLQQYLLTTSRVLLWPPADNLHCSKHNCWLGLLLAPCSNSQWIPIKQLMIIHDISLLTENITNIKWNPGFSHEMSTWNTRTTIIYTKSNKIFHKSRHGHTYTYVYNKLSYTLMSAHIRTANLK